MKNYNSKKIIMTLRAYNTNMAQSLFNHRKMRDKLFLKFGNTLDPKLINTCKIYYVENKAKQNLLRSSYLFMEDRITKELFCVQSLEMPSGAYNNSLIKIDGFTWDSSYEHYWKRFDTEK